MTPTIFDIETTAIDCFRTLKGLESIHCLVLRQGNDTTYYTKENMVEGLKFLRNQDLIVGHNVTGFDIPAIQKLYPDWKPRGLVRDTVLMARLAYPDQKDRDYQIDDFPRNLVGHHSLEAWGHRLGEHKGDYTGGWDELTDEMLDYCIQDTVVTQKLYEKIMAEDISPEALALEHMFADCIGAQERHGFAFNVKKAAELYAELSDGREGLRTKLVASFPPTVVKMKTPAHWVAAGDKFPTKTAAKKAGHKDADIRRGPPKEKVTPFNPDSRQQIARCLIDKYGWEPEVFTPNGQPQVDESILKALPHEEAKMLVDYLTISKRIGQLAEGNEAWLKLEDHGRIYGRVNTMGTVTSRCSHSRPNVAQVPAVYAPYGKECRGLFTAGDRKVLVGADASGLELRCLAHYLHRYDGGIYADIIVDGDIHTANQKAAGLETRDQAKTFIYAWLYGAGPQKIGSIVDGGVKDGQRLMTRFLSKMPALKHLKSAIEKTLKSRGYLVGLDGRHIPIRSKHSALNALLQCAGAVLMKQATVDARRLHRMEQLDAHQVAHIHDEIQYEVALADAERVGELTVKAIQEAGTPFGFKCPLDGEYKIGRDWSETH